MGRTPVELNRRRAGEKRFSSRRRKLTDRDSLVGRPGWSLDQFGQEQEEADCRRDHRHEARHDAPVGRSSLPGVVPGVEDVHLPDERLTLQGTLAL